MFARSTQVAFLRKFMQLIPVSSLLFDIAELCKERALEADAEKDWGARQFWEWEMTCCETAARMLRETEIRRATGSGPLPQKHNS